MLSLVGFLQVSHKMEMQVKRNCRRRGSISESEIGNAWDDVFTLISTVTIKGASALGLLS